MSAATAPTVQAGPQGAGRTRAPLRRVLAAEWTKLMSVRSTAVALLGTVGVAAGLAVLLAVSRANNYDSMTARERSYFDPTFSSLSGIWLAQLVIGTLGVLMATSEWSTGTVRATFAATTGRLRIAVAKILVLAAVALTVGLVLASVSFASGQAILSTVGAEAHLGDPGVVRAVFGGALYIAVVALLGLGLGMAIRASAGAISVLVGLVFVLPLLSSAFPQPLQDQITPYLPAIAGSAVFSTKPDPVSLGPWTGFGVLCLYAAAALVAGTTLLVRRDP